MSEIFEKLNLKDQQEILVLHAPESFQPELARLPILTIHYHIESVPEISFFLAFVTRKSEVDELAKAVASRTPGDAIVWFAYPKGTSKKYTCDFNRDTGWGVLKALGFDTVRAVAIDDDWTALRFRRVEYIKTRENNTEAEPAAAPKISAPKLTPPEKGRAKPLPPSPRRRK